LFKIKPAGSELRAVRM